MELIMNYLNNYFYRFKERGFYIIKDNKIAIKGKYVIGQYVLIKGSILNDGVYKVLDYSNNALTLENLTDEEFEGYVCSLAVPKSFEKICEQIEEFNDKKNVNSLYISESKGDYSYTRATGKDGMPIKWEDAFSKSLSPYKKIYDEFRHVKEIR